MRGLAKLALCVLLWAGADVASADNGRWLRAESQNFIVYSDGQEQALRNAVRNLEVFDGLLRALMRTTEEPSPAKLKIYLLRNRRGLQEVWPNVPETVGGFYSASTEHIGAFAVYNSNGGLDAQDILFHEYAHHFMAQYGTMAYPGWFVEGYAEYVATAEIRYDRVVVGDYSQGRALALINGGAWIPMTEMLAPRRDDMNASEANRYYAQSWIAAHYLFNTPERLNGMLRYFDALRAGGDAVTAFEPAVGVSPDAFEDELRSYVRGRLGRVAWNSGRQEAPEITITRLPASADQLLLLDVRLKRHIAPEQKDALIARVLEVSAAFPNDAFATRVRAMAELVREDTGAARALLEPLATADANDWETQYLLGATYLVDAMRDEVRDPRPIAQQGRRHFARAFRINPDYPPNLYFYARTFMFDAPPMADAPLDVLTKAHLLAPQVQEISLNLAAQLMMADRHRDAIGVIAPHVYSAHSSGGAAYARRMLEAAQKGEAPPRYEPSE